MNRLHPIYILYDAKKWIPFLLIPVLRALFKPGDAVYILLASIRDTGLALLLIAYSILKWKQARYSLHDGLTLDQGLIYRRRLRLMADDAASVEVDDRVTHGVTNVGIRPTVGADAPLAETWIADFTGDLYGKAVPVSLVQFLRPEQKFESVEELQRQILRDGREARRAVLGDSAAGIRAVLFDFDDTLQDRSRAFDKFTAFFMDKYFPHLSGEEKARRGIEMRERNNGGYVNYIDYFASLVESWRWEGAPEVGDLYREFQFRFPECSTLFPETKEVLTELRRRGFLLGIVTNGPSIQQNRKLDVAGLRPFVDLCMVAGDEQVHKPDPEIFRRAASRLGVACGSCLYVGDHPVNDIEGAAAAGMRPVYINAARRDFHPDNVIEIHSLRELLDVV